MKWNFFLKIIPGFSFNNIKPKSAVREYENKRARNSKGTNPPKNRKR